MKFRRLSSAEYAAFEAHAATAGISPRQCPTCGSKPFTAIDVGGGDLGEAEGRIAGTYRYKGKKHPCDCETQIMLHKHYLVAGIGDQYQRLNWEDYRDEEVRTSVRLYLDRWENFKLLGMGVEFHGEKLGTGKTFAATHVGKELIKRGERVFFISFLDLVSLYQREEAERERLSSRLRDTTVLILDEVKPATINQAHLFSEKLEALIRHRTNFNLPTIVTTNMSPDALWQQYPRSFSLLDAKQMRIAMIGKDARMWWLGEHNTDMAVNGEVPPII